MKFVWETPEEINKALAQRLSRIRKRRNLSQQALSEKSNVSYGSIKRFETTGQISLNSLTKLCVALDCADEIKNLFTNVEYGSIEDIFERPKHPYTQGLLNSIPRLDEDVELLNTIEGTVPAPDAMPAGCRFAPRCPYGKDRCMKEKPGVYHAGNSLVSCFRYEGEK